MSHHKYYFGLLRSWTNTRKQDKFMIALGYSVSSLASHTVEHLVIR